jgi:hypothetical protein
MQFNYSGQARLVKTFHTIYDNRRFAVGFIKAPHWTTSEARQILKYDFLQCGVISCGLYVHGHYKGSGCFHHQVRFKRVFVYTHV